jgi:organic hydroperoxide reductase OsmC/OhrA
MALRAAHALSIQADWAATAISPRSMLRPEVGFAEPAQAARATELHKRAHELCFIANSVNFPVRCDPV